MVGARSHGAISHVAAVTAPGLMVVVVILFMGVVSGAHLNPAVSLAFAARGGFPWRRVPGYILVRLGRWAQPSPAPAQRDPGDDRGAAADDRPCEHHLGHSVRRQNVGMLDAVGVGGCIILAGLWSSPISGASMNRPVHPVPAWSCSTSGCWAYVAGPLAGGLIAVGFASILRGRGGGESGSAAAQGRLGTVSTTHDED